VLDGVADSVALVCGSDRVFIVLIFWFGFVSLIGSGDGWSGDGECRVCAIRSWSRCSASWT
jgi:hypothetical protein